MEAKTAIKLVDSRAILPKYSTELAAGFDIAVIEGATVQPDSIVGLRHSDSLDPNSSLVECEFNHKEAVRLQLKRHPVILRTGIAIQLQPDEELEIRGRSGLGFKYDILPFNGTIDADYTGEIMVKVWNLGDQPFEVTQGMRIAQGVIKKVLRKEFVEVGELKLTDRGDGGFASTGLN